MCKNENYKFMEKLKSKHCKHDKNYQIGIIAALMSSTLWGILPIYWKSISPIPPHVIILYRILLVPVVTYCIACKRHGFKKVMFPFKNRDKKFLLRMLLIGVLITLNWSIYIWAVNTNQIVQTSIGYYIEPIFVCLIGMLFFREKITMFNLTAVGFAAVGMVILIVHYMQVPGIAIAIGITFAIYAAAKKKLDIEPELSLFYETIFLAPIALTIIIYLETSGTGAISAGKWYQYMLLMFSGLATALPLGLFAIAANKLSMITLGITSYISPSLALLLGVLFYGEPFDEMQFIAFVVVWIGLAIFTVGEYRMMKTRRNAGDEKMKDYVI